MPLDSSARTTAPVSLRSSAASNFSLLPPPASTKRLAFRPAGRCRIAISSAFPLNSPESYSSLVWSAAAASGAAPSNPTTTNASESTSPSFFGSSLISIAALVPFCLLYLYLLFYRLSAFSDGGAGFRFHLPGTLSFALVVQLLTLGDGQLYLDVTAFQIHLGGNERQPFFTRFSQ